MDFIGVEFSASCGGGLAIINKNWLTPRKKDTFWPPYKTQSVFEKALKTGEAPNESHWKVYPVSRCFFETDDYSKARSKLKRAELHSDVQSSSDADEGCSRKRAHRPPKRLCYESSDDEESHNILPAPPSLNISLDRSKNLRNEDLSGSLVRSPHTSVNFTKRNRPSRPLLYTEICDTFNEESDEPSLNLLNSRDSSPNLDHTIVEVDNLLPGTGRDIDDTKYKSLLRLLTYIKRQNDQIVKQNEAILQSLKKRAIVPEHTSYQLPNDVPVKIPIQQLQEIAIVEEYLSEDDHLVALSAYLSTLGGRDITTKTNTILRSVISNKVAVNFSFLGTRNNKQAFTKLNLHKLIIRAVQLSTPNTPEHEINENVKVWLKHAPQRLSLDQKKKQK